MGNLIEKFIEKNKYSNKILKDSVIYSKYEISPIVSKFGIYKDEIDKDISVADIIEIHYL